MNILWIPNFLPFPIDNGGKIVTANRIRELSKTHKIYMVCDVDSIDKKISKELNQICEDYVLLQEKPKNNINRLFSLFRSSYYANEHRNPLVTKAIKDIIKKYDIDLINIDLPLPAVNLIGIMNDLGDIPIVINQQNVESKNIASRCHADGISFPMRVFSWIESKQLFKWEKKLYKYPQIKGQTFVSEEDLREFEELYGRGDNTKFFYSPIGTLLPPSIEKKGDDTKVIVMPASFDYRPNAHGAVWFANEVYPLIRKKVQGVKLFLVGRNPREEVKKLACNDIIVTGSVESMNPYMCMADLYIVPIFFGGGVKTKLIEMGMYGRPVISTSQGCKGSIYKEDVDLLICDDNNSFADKCISILSNPKEYQLLGEHMKKTTIDNYLWSNIARDYSDFLLSVVD